MKLNTRTIVAIGIGSAIFLVLNRFVSIPTPIPNTNISTAYPFLAFMAALFGPIAGSCWNRLSIERGETKLSDFITFNVFQIIGNAIAWGLIAPGLDMLIYAEPAQKVFSQAAAASLANMLSILILGSLFLFAYSKTRTQSGSLREE